MSNRRREVTVVATLSLKKGVNLQQAKAEVRDRVNAECGDPGRRDIQIKRLTRYTAPDPAAVPAIDLAYSRINALGGTNDAHDDRIAGFLDAIDEALKILTDLGAKDAPYSALLADAEKA